MPPSSPVVLAGFASLLRKELSGLWALMAGAAFTKGIGSVFRIHDNRHAPEDVKTDIIQREVTIVALTTLASGMIQHGYKQAAGWLAQLGPQAVRQGGRFLLEHEKRATLLLVGLGTIAAEVVSRKLHPPNLWPQPEAPPKKPLPDPLKASPHPKHAPLPTPLTFAQGTLSLPNHSFSPVPGFPRAAAAPLPPRPRPLYPVGRLAL